MEKYHCTIAKALLAKGLRAAITAVMLFCFAAQAKAEYQVFRPSEGQDVAAKFHFVVKGETADKPGILEVSSDRTFADVHQRRYHSAGWVAVEDWWQMEVDASLLGDGTWFWRIAGDENVHSFNIAGMGDPVVKPMEDAFYEPISLDGMAPGTSMVLTNKWMRTEGDMFANDADDYIANENIAARVTHNFVVKDGYIILPEFLDFVDENTPRLQRYRIIDASTGRQVNLCDMPLPYNFRSLDSRYRRFDEIGIDDAGTLWLGSGYYLSSNKDEVDDVNPKFAANASNKSNYRKWAENIIVTKKESDRRFYTFKENNTTYLNFLVFPVEFKSDSLFLKRIESSRNARKLRIVDDRVFYNYNGTKVDFNSYHDMVLRGDLLNNNFRAYIIHSSSKDEYDRNWEDLKFFGWKCTDSSLEGNLKSLDSNRDFYGKINAPDDSLQGYCATIQPLDSRTFLYHARNYGPKINNINTGKYTPAQILRLNYSDEMFSVYMPLESRYEMPKASESFCHSGNSAHMFKFDDKWFVLENTACDSLITNSPAETLVGIYPEGYKSQVKFTLRRVDMPDFEAKKIQSHASAGKLKGTISAEQMWNFPTADIRPNDRSKFNPRTSVYVDSVSGKDKGYADIYVYCPGRFMSAYRLQKMQTTGVASLNSSDSAVWSYDGNVLTANNVEASAQGMEVYNASGSLVARSSDITLHEGNATATLGTEALPSGIYIARCGTAYYKFRKQ